MLSRPWFSYVARVALALFVLQPSSFILAQGGLTPPGAPAPTMKTLDQLEPRTIVNAANTPGNATNTFIISQPGSYYITGNITGAPNKHGISVQANDVTLDLNGFALVSGGGAGLRGVDVPSAQTNFTIRNGTIRGWTGGGVRSDAAGNTLAEKLTLSGNTGAPGISVGNGALVRDCVASANGTGIQTADRCQVISCISTVNTGNGFVVTNYVTLTDCTSSRNGAAGIFAGGAYLISRCSFTRNDGGGIEATGSGTIAECSASNNAATGINLFAGAPAVASSITNCSANANGSFGISAVQSSIINCTGSGNGDGGISAANGVVAFCRAVNNNQNNNGSVDIAAAGATRTGNNPGP
jgi:hypothetical protein